MCQGWETLIQSHRVGVKISWDHICKALSTVSIKYSITEILLQLSQENGNQTYSQELIDQQSYLHHTSLLILLTSLLLRLIFPAVLWMPSLAPSFISTLFLCSVFNFSLFTASFPSFWKYTQGSLKYINACDSFPLTRALSPFLTQLVGGTLPTLLLPGGSAVKNLTAKQETGVQSLGQEDPLEKEIATHSSILAWEILWTEEPGRLQSMGSQTVRHDWATNHHHHPHYCPASHYFLRQLLHPGFFTYCSSETAFAKDLDPHHSAAFNPVAHFLLETFSCLDFC